MIESFWDVFVFGFAMTIIAAWRSIPILGVVLLVDRFFGRRISPRFQCGMWLLVIGRLILPFSVESPLSVSGFADSAIVPFGEFAFELIDTFENENNDSDANANGEFEIVTFALNSGEKISVPVLPEEVSQEVRLSAEAYAAVVHTQRMDLEANPRVAKVEVPSIDWEETIIYSLSAIWFAGVVGIVVQGVFAYGRFAWRLRRCPEATDTVVREGLTTVCKELHLKTRPRVLIVDSLSAPAVFGVWRPVLCLPAVSLITLSSQEMIWVMRHEVAHIKRRDSLVLSVAMLVRAIHWINPIAWIAVSNLKSNIEQAADDLATRNMEPSTIVEYGRLLLRYVTRDQQFAQRPDQPSLVGLLSMASGSRLKQRVARLGRSHRRHWLFRIASVALFILAGTSGLTDAMTTSNGRSIFAGTDQADSSPLFESTRDLQHVEFVPAPKLPKEVIDEPTAEPEGKREVTLNVETALRKARLLLPGLNEESFVRECLKIDDRDAKIYQGILTANMSPSAETSCLRTIQMYESTFEKQIVLSVRKIQADVALGKGFKWNLSAIVPAERFSKSPPTAAITTLLSEIETLLFIYRCQKPTTGDILFAPKATLFSGQSAELSFLTTTRLVTGVRSIPGELGGALQSVTEWIEAGMEIHCHADATEDDGVELKCTIIESKIDDIREAVLPIKSPLDPTKFMTVQVPNISRNTVASSVRLAKNESLLIACALDNPKAKDKGTSIGTFYLVSAVVIPADAIPASATTHLEFVR